MISADNDPHHDKLAEIEIHHPRNVKLHDLNKL
jgi:hypothetical protein